MQYPVHTFSLELYFPNHTLIYETRKHAIDLFLFLKE